MNETKYITVKNLNVGQTIHGYKIDGYISICTKVVQEITPFQVKIAWESAPERSECDYPECGAHHDRDVNAAINIRKRGLAELTA